MSSKVTVEPDGPCGEEDADVLEAELLRRVCQHDRSAFTALYTRFHWRLHRFLARILCRHDQVEELINDVMLTVWQRASDFHGRSRPATWIFGIAYKKALKRLRSIASHREEVREVIPEVVDDVLPDKALSDAQLRVAVSRALAALPVEHRAVVTLTFFQGYSYGEIASIVQCPTNTVKTRMFHAREHLRQLLPRAEFLTGEED